VTHRKDEGYTMANRKKSAIEETHSKNTVFIPTAENSGSLENTGDNDSKKDKKTKLSVKTDTKQLKTAKNSMKPKAKVSAKPSTKKGGRRGKFEKWLEPDNLEKIKDWRRNGATFEDLSKLMKVSVSTIKKWGVQFSAFSAALKEGEIYDDEAEQVLHTLGVTGWVVQDVVEELRVNPATGKEELMVVKRVTKQIPPSASALIFWLKNRRPDKWRDKRDIIDISDHDEFTGIAEMPAVLEPLEPIEIIESNTQKAGETHE